MPNGQAKPGIHKVQNMLYYHPIPADRIGPPLLAGITAAKVTEDYLTVLLRVVESILIKTLGAVVKVMPPFLCYLTKPGKFSMSDVELSFMQAVGSACGPRRIPFTLVSEHEAIIMYAFEMSYFSTTGGHGASSQSQ